MVVAAATVLGGTAAPAASQGWRDGGLITGPHESLMMDGSAADVVVAVGTTGPSPERPRATRTIARRMPDGRWARVRARIGEPVGVHVNGRGDAVIVSSRNQTVVATTWPRWRTGPVTRVVLRSSEAPAAYFDMTSVANGRGDVTVLLTAWPGYGDRAVLLRKPVREPWKRPLTIGRSRYGGALDSVDIGRRGVVAATFKDDRTLSVRNLPLRRSRFGAATEVTTWPELDESGRYRESIADVMVGQDGDLATTWAYAATSGGSSQLVRSRLNIRPVQRRPWQRDFEHADDRLDLLAVARDGSVLVRDGLETRRWNPATRRLQGRGTWFFKDANVRGDALIGSGLYGGLLRLWPVGPRRGPAVSAPAGSLGPVVLTGERRAYVAVSDGRGLPHAFRLRIRRF